MPAVRMVLLKQFDAAGFVSVRPQVGGNSWLLPRIPRPPWLFQLEILLPGPVGRAGVADDGRRG